MLRNPRTRSWRPKLWWCFCCLLHRQQVYLFYGRTGATNPELITENEVTVSQPLTSPALEKGSHCYGQTYSGSPVSSVHCKSARIKLNDCLLNRQIHIYSWKSEHLNTWTKQAKLITEFKKKKCLDFVAVRQQEHLIKSDHQGMLTIPQTYH